jgi:hypothetical protein
MIYVGVFVRLLIFIVGVGRAFGGQESLGVLGRYGRENKCHVMVLGGIWMDGVWSGASMSERTSGNVIWQSYGNGILETHASLDPYLYPHGA